MPDARRYQFRAITGLLILAGLAFVGVAVYYFVTPAGSLASFVPGHQAGSFHHHMKHGVAALAVAVVLWIGAWFTTAPGGQAGS
jgi:amino acid permease